MVASVYAFDVDDTLEVSDGPVSMAALRELVEQGHIVGLCGNWSVVVRTVADWHEVVSFLGPLGTNKAEFLQQLKQHVPASGYVMVGNDPTTGFGASLDRTSAAEAGWRFLLERDFAAGAR